MKSYREWQNEKPMTAPTQPTKKWKATKEQIVQFWQQLQPNIPLAMTPIPYQHAGSTYQQDGIRITGSKEFIASTIARLKEFMQYENPRTKLSLVYRETEKGQPGPAGEGRVTYVFYLQAKERGGGEKPDGTAPAAPKPPTP